MFFIQKNVSKWGEMLISPAMILIGSFMLFGDRLNLPRFGFSGNLETNKLNGISLIIEATKFDYEKIYNIIKNVPRLIDKYPYFEGMIDDMNVFVSKMKSDYELFEQ